MQQQTPPTHYMVPADLMTTITAILAEQPAKIVHNVLNQISQCAPMYDKGSMVVPPQPGGEDSTTEEN